MLYSTANILSSIIMGTGAHLVYKMGTGAHLVYKMGTGAHLVYKMGTGAQICARVLTFHSIYIFYI